MKLGRIIALLATAASVSAVGCSNEEDTVDAREAVPSVEAFHIADTQRPQVTGDVKNAALSYVRNFNGELGLSPQDDFEVRQVHQGSG